MLAVTAKALGLSILIVLFGAGLATMAAKRAVSDWNAIPPKALALVLPTSVSSNLAGFWERQLHSASRLRLLSSSKLERFFLEAVMFSWLFFELIWWFR